MVDDAKVRPLHIALLAKFPPVQGGVSTEAWEFCEAAIEAGHQVTVVTNASEAEAGVRSLFSDADRKVVEALSPRLKVFQTTAQPASTYIPYANPYLSKLLGLGRKVFAQERFDLVFGWYLEPYVVAAAFLADWHGLPLFVRTAGSDLGRLSTHPDLESLYIHVLSHAHAVLSGPPGSATHQRLLELGVNASRIVSLKATSLPRRYRPDGPQLQVDWRSEILEELGAAQGADVSLWREYLDLNDPKCREPSLPTVCVYGKVGKVKGTDALFRALDVVGARGHAMNVLWIAGGVAKDLIGFFARARAFKAAGGGIVVLPLVAPWRIPELLRTASITCLLEHEFPIASHSPRLPREVLAGGSCLVISRELVERQRFAANLVHMKNCVIVESPGSEGELADALCGLLANPIVRNDIARHGYFLSRTLEKFLEPGNATFHALVDLHNGPESAVNQPAGP